MLNKNSTPYDLGFTLPAEWHPHAATWTCWPFDEEVWSGKLEYVRREFCEFVKTIARFEPLNLIISDKNALSSALNYLGNTEHIVYHELPLNDIWFRDNGPIFIKKDNKICFVKWEFNAWGQKFNWELDNQAPYYVAKNLNLDFWDTKVVLEGGSLDGNGAGIVLTTKQCLLNKMRNPTLTETNLENYLKQYLGIQKVLWLEDGLEGDHTDGHIDTIVRFVNENTIVYSIAEDIHDKNFATMRRNFELLNSFTNLNNEKFNLVPLLLPKNTMHLGQNRLPCTYANFYIGNGFVIVPQYDDPNDKIALSTLSSLFPGRKVIGLNSKYLITGGGSFHCVTQQQPA